MKGAKWVLSLLVIFGLCGCVKVDQEITLNKDGSGRVSMMYAMSEQSIQQMEAMAEMMAQQGGEGSQSDSLNFDQAKVEKEFEGLKDKGIKLKSVKSEVKDGWRYIYIVFNFQDISRLKDTSLFKDSEMTITKNADGNYVISSVVSGQGMGPGGENKMEDIPPQMMAMFQGMRIAMKFNTPGTIIETTAPIKGKKSAAWVFDVDKDPEALSKMSGKEMRIVFEGKGCAIPEIK